MKEILTVAGMLVVPAFHNHTKLGNQESRKLLVKLLPEMADQSSGSS